MTSFASHLIDICTWTPFDTPKFSVFFFFFHEVMRHQFFWFLICRFYENFLKVSSPSCWSHKMVTHKTDSKCFFMRQEKNRPLKASGTPQKLRESLRLLPTKILFPWRKNRTWSFLKTFSLMSFRAEQQSTLVSEERRNEVDEKTKWHFEVWRTLRPANVTLWGRGRGKKK